MKKSEEKNTIFTNMDGLTELSETEMAEIDGGIAPLAIGIALAICLVAGCSTEAH